MGMGVNGQRKSWPTKVADAKLVESEVSWDALSEGARLVEPSALATNGSVPPRPAAAPAGSENGGAAKTNGAQFSPTLKHLVGPNPSKEWAELCMEEERLLERLQKVVAARARLEVHMAVAGALLRRTVTNEAPAEADY